MGPARGVLHFVNRVDETNAGDRVASPLNHYLQQFSDFPIRRHDIRYIEWDLIHAGDVIVLGGGGLFNHAEFLNRAINRLLASGVPVIGWAPGFNTHVGTRASFRTQIDFERFALLAVRDYENEHRIDYLPDVTCRMPQLRHSHTTRRRFGVARHKDHPLPEFDFDTITNEDSVDDILTFIGESEVVISNSYHLIYWATLMGKRCVSPPGFSTRFEGFEHPPTFLLPGEDPEDAAARAVSYDVVDQCIARNDDFFEKAIKIIEERLTPGVRSSDYYDLATRAVISEQKAREPQLLCGDLVASKLLIDTGDGFVDAQRVDSASNVYGDPELIVSFDVSEYDGIQRIRFHPLDGWVSRVSIISAVSALGDLGLTPVGAVSDGKYDTFLTTNPCYMSSAPLAGPIDITFRVELVPKPEAEWNILRREELLGLRTAERDQMASEFALTYDHLMGTVGELEQVRNELEAAHSDLAETREHLERIERSYSWRATRPARRLMGRIRSRRPK